MMMRGRTRVLRLWALRMKWREHLLGDLEVGDDAVLHGTDGHDVAGGAAQHLLGVLAHRLDLSRDLVDGHDGRLGDDDALALRVDEGVGGTEVDGEVVREKAQVEEGTKVHESVMSPTCVMRKSRCEASG